MSGMQRAFGAPAPALSHTEMAPPVWGFFHYGILNQTMIGGEIRAQ